jgi:hypothetical protein
MPPEMPQKSGSEHHARIDDVGTGQKMAHPEGLVEFVRHHSAVLTSPSPDRHAAEAGQPTHIPAVPPAPGTSSTQSGSGCAIPALFFRAFTIYIEAAGSPAMETNGRANREQPAALPATSCDCLPFGPSAGITAIGGNGC